MFDKALPVAWIYKYVEKQYEIGEKYNQIGEKSMCPRKEKKGEN